MPRDPASQSRSAVERRGVAAAESMVVIEPLNPWTCTSCGGSGSLLLMDDAGPLCMGCADLDHLVFLPAGDTALSRRARKASRLAAVVVRFSRSRKRYERQGILVEEAALEQAEAQCLADEEARARRRERDRQRRADQDVAFEAQLAEAVVQLFPGCPAGRAEAIARHAGLQGAVVAWLDRLPRAPDRGEQARQMNANRSTYLTSAMANLARDSWSLRRRNVQLWQQNTSTRKLTEEMLDGVFFRARELLR